MIGPDGRALPPGHGTAKEGAEIFAKRCAVCHGQNGQGGIVRSLVIGSPGHPHQGPFTDTEKDGPSYYPFPTIAWDYINRAMPASKPGSLTPDEVYAVVAFLYYRNGIIAAEGRNAEPEWLRSGSARVPAGKEAQLVLKRERPRASRPLKVSPSSPSRWVAERPEVTRMIPRNI
jgi:cytochrome c